MRSQILAVAALSCLVGDCVAGPARNGLQCNLYSPAALPGERGVKSAEDALQDLRTRIQQGYQQRSEVKARDVDGVAPKQARAYNILSLSAGGQYGAYGSGFLKGWSERADLTPSRSEIDLVTGVSTGAMMATFAFLGSSSDEAVRKEYDERLKALYGTLRNEDVFRKRWLIELLWSNSLYDSGPLRKVVTREIARKNQQGEEILDAVAREGERGRLLFVMAVNAFTGQTEVFDLVRIASDRTQDRHACYVEAIMASAAIPIAFTPVQINGEYYVDGGARQHLFFLDQVNKALGTGTIKRVLAILHGDLKVQKSTKLDNLLDVAGRTAAIATDQLVFDSAYYVNAEAVRRGYEALWTSAVNSNCVVLQNNSMFDPCLENCLWVDGYLEATQDSPPWVKFDQIYKRRSRVEPKECRKQ